MTDIVSTFKFDTNNNKDEYAGIPANLTFKAYAGKGGRVYYVPEVDNKSDHIYVHEPRNKEGFGGSKFTLTLESGDKVVGTTLWHTNSKSMLKETGVDLTGMNRVSYCISKGIIYDKNPYGVPSCTGVVEVVSEQLMDFDYPEKRVEELVEQLKQDLYLYRRSCGGSSSGKHEYKVKEIV